MVFFVFGGYVVGLVAINFLAVFNTWVPFSVFRLYFVHPGDVGLGNLFVVKWFLILWALVGLLVQFVLFQHPGGIQHTWETLRV